METPKNSQDPLEEDSAQYSTDSNIQPAVEQSSPPKRHLPLIGIFLLILLFTIIGIFIYFYKPLPLLRSIIENSQPGKDTYITSYEECILQAEVLKDKYICPVAYRSDHQPKSYNTCKQNGGSLSCPGNPPLIEDCSLGYMVCHESFYNPNFIFPTTYEECRKISLDGGSYMGINHCTIYISKENSANKEYTNELLDRCIKLGGYEDGGNCSYIVIEPNPERKMIVAEDCRQTDLTLFKDSSIQKVCEWALSSD